MFDKYGDMTASEINELARNMRKEGDFASLEVLAKENGISADDVEDFEAGEDSDGYGLCTDAVLAIGKIKIQQESSKLDKAAQEPIYSIARNMVLENKAFAKAVSVKGKRLDDIMGELKKMAEGNKSGNCGVACGTDRDLEMIIAKHYGVTI